jgi:hypothetical protein
MIIRFTPAEEPSVSVKYIPSAKLAGGQRTVALWSCDCGGVKAEGSTWIPWWMWHKAGCLVIPEGPR